MGMDISGKNPSSEEGEYFRAAIWSWLPIYDLVCRLCSDLLDHQTLESMSYNDGAGPNDQETCTKMAFRFDRWMKHYGSGHEVQLGWRFEVETHRLLRAEEAEEKGVATEAAYHTSDEHLKDWVEFLRHCGGFEVW